MDLNHRPTAYEAAALPLCYIPVNHGYVREPFKTSGRSLVSPRYSEESTLTIQDAGRDEPITIIAGDTECGFYDATTNEFS